MAPNLRSDSGALEHIMAVLLEQPVIDSETDILPPFCACFSEAGVVLPPTLSPFLPQTML